MPDNPNNQGPFSDPNKPNLTWRDPSSQEGEGSVEPRHERQGRRISVPEIRTGQDESAPKVRQPEVPRQQVSDQVTPHEEPSRPAPRKSAKNAADGEIGFESLLGPNYRWLWFAGGVLFVFIGVAIAFAFNFRKPQNVRNDAIKWAFIGMVIGMVINTITLVMAGGMDTIMSPVITGQTSGGVF